MEIEITLRPRKHVNVHAKTLRKTFFIEFHGNYSRCQNEKLQGVKCFQGCVEKKNCENGVAIDFVI